MLCFSLFWDMIVQKLIVPAVITENNYEKQHMYELSRQGIWMTTSTYMELAYKSVNVKFLI